MTDVYYFGGREQNLKLNEGRGSPSPHLTRQLFYHRIVLKTKWEEGRGKYKDIAINFYRKKYRIEMGRNKEIITKPTTSHNLSYTPFLAEDLNNAQRKYYTAGHFS